MPEEKLHTDNEAFLQVAMQMMTSSPDQRIMLILEKADGSNQFVSNTNSLGWNLGILKIMYRTVKRSMIENRNRDAETKAMAEQARAFEEAAKQKKGNVQ